MVPMWGKLILVTRLPAHKSHIGSGSIESTQTGLFKLDSMRSKDQMEPSLTRRSMNGNQTAPPSYPQTTSQLARATVSIKVMPQAETFER
jgi:hypothetical protein